jgi:hypothetical protein
MIQSLLGRQQVGLLALPNLQSRLLVMIGKAIPYVPGLRRRL